jgi:hypothetical protein
MKKLLLSFLVSLFLSSCASLLTGRPDDAKVITDYNARMEVLKQYFPELYNLYTTGKIEIVDVYMYNFKEGKPKFNVTTRRL